MVHNKTETATVPRNQKSPPRKKTLTGDNLPEGIIAIQYGVQGPVSKRLLEIARDMEQGVKMPFERLLPIHVGDGQASNNSPLSYFRQLIAALLYPPLCQLNVFPEDVRLRADSLLKECCGNSVGASTAPFGAAPVRKRVARFIEARDGGIPCNYEDILLFNGTASIIRILIGLLSKKIDGRSSGIMLPTPQYPLFSACLQEHGIEQISYRLDESRGWDLDVDSLYSSVKEAKKFCNPRAIVIINPGNPTGQIMSLEEVKSVIEFAYEESLVIFADEVYQELSYVDDLRFYSFKKVLHDMGEPYSSQVELFSFMSSSKGVMFESGLRGGLVEMVNIDQFVRDKLYTVLASQLCANTIGQVAVDVMVNPPSVGDASYESFMAEKARSIAALKRRSKMVADFFNSVPGVHSNVIESGYYAFPRIDMSPKVYIEAEKRGIDVDTYYAMELLENTGISFSPGSSFGQDPGTHHFRASFLPQEETLEMMMSLFEDFHKKFIARHS